MSTNSYSEESDDQASIVSDEFSTSNNKVKFLGSYGGKIVPRSGDGKLRYVGGITRVVSVSRSITFTEMVAKMEQVFGCGEQKIVVKCQMPTQDMDALVSVRSNEDLDNVLEEYDKIGAHHGLSKKVRAFLFPTATLHRLIEQSSPTRRQPSSYHAPQLQHHHNQSLLLRGSYQRHQLQRYESIDNTHRHVPAAPSAKDHAPIAPSSSLTGMGISLSPPSSYNGKGYHHAPYHIHHPQNPFGQHFITQH